MRHLADGASAGTSKMKYQKTFLCLFSTLLAGSVAAGCATGVEDSDGSGGSSGDDTNASSSTASSSSSSSQASSSSSSASSSGSGNPMCGPKEHLCGGICAPNSVQTGCYQSQDCLPCATVQNGTVKCSEDGLCDVDCTSGYVKSGNTCQCATQCCSDSDCGSGQQCDNGQCITPCDPAACILQCLFLEKIGVCENNQCVCKS